MEKQDKKWYVYMHTNKINNKKYIGITSEKDPNRRWKNGFGYKQQVFFRAIQKYSWENFDHEIILTNLTEKEAKIKEQELIAKYQSNNPLYGYNRSKGGDVLPEKTPELLEKISSSLKEYYKTEEGIERKRQISKQKKKYYSTHDAPFKGRKHSEETKKIMSEKAKQRKPNRSIPINMVDDNNNIIKSFNSKQEVLKFLNIICYTSLNKALMQHTKYRNYFWEYTN